MMKRFTILLAVAWVVMGVIGCAQYSKKGASAQTMSIDMAMASPPPASAVGGVRMETLRSATPTGAGANMSVPPVKTAQNRKVIYTASLGLQVANRDQALGQVHALIQRLDGFVQHATLDSVTFRVPPARFEEAIKSLTGMGQVLSRDISSEDVTEQYVDVETRIKTAEESRDRLRALLAKAAKTEDLLKIEADIRRLTEEIEVMKGRLRVLADHVDLATITVSLSERPVVQQTRTTRLTSDRFEWIDWTGVDHLQESVSSNAKLSGSPLMARMFVGPAFHLSVPEDMVAPEGFVPLWHKGDRLLATTPEDYRMRLLLVEIRQTASMAFWAETLKAELGQRRGYAISQVGEAPFENQALEGWLLRATTNQGGEEWDYNVWLVRRRDIPGRMAIIEYACVHGQGDAQRAKVSEAVAGMELRPSMWKAPFTQGCFAVQRLF